MVEMRAGDWVRIELGDDDLGWVYVPLVNLDGDVNTLEVVDSIVEVLDDTVLNPMQAFTFHSGIGDSQCSEMPQSGILIQTPEGARGIEFAVNGVNLTIGSTIFLQAEADDEMLVYTLEGQARVEAFEKEVLVPAGAQTSIPLDGTGNASDVPSDPEPLNAEATQGIPVDVLVEEIIVAEPLTVEEIVEIVEAANEYTVFLGNWSATDFDGIPVSLTILGDPEVGFSMLMTAGPGGACADAEGREFTGSGGHIDGDTLLIDTQLSCVTANGLEQVRTQVHAFTYHPDDNTLVEEEYGVVWSR